MHESAATWKTRPFPVASYIVHFSDQARHFPHHIARCAQVLEGDTRTRDGASLACETNPYNIMMMATGCIYQISLDASDIFDERFHKLKMLSYLLSTS